MLRGLRRRAGTETMRFGEYELRVEVLHARTRSEGRVGRLYRGGDEVQGTSTGETVTVAPGGPVLVYLGAERPHLWSVSGWAVQPTGE